MLLLSALETLLKAERCKVRPGASEAAATVYEEK
jgi:hypothetical protein